MENLELYLTKRIKSRERESFYKAMTKIGLECPRAEIARNFKDAKKA